MHADSAVFGVGAIPETHRNEGASEASKDHNAAGTHSSKLRHGLGGGLE